MSLLDHIASELMEARLTRRPVPPISERHPDLSVADAYAIQSAVRDRMTRDQRVVGHKIGLTSKAMQEQLGIDQPDFGFFTRDMCRRSPAVFDAAELIDPMVEAEIAFFFDRPIKPGSTVEEILAASVGIAPALEIIDSRIEDWRIGLVDTVADNASCGAVVIGERTPVKTDLDSVEMRLRSGGQTAEGRGANVLGHPAAAVVWLADILAEFEEDVGSGIVMSGAWSRALPIRPGEDAAADFGELGTVRLTLT